MKLEVSAYTIPVDGPGGKESDGTLEWDSTTCVVVEAREGGRTGLGYTYGPAAIGAFVEEKLAGVVADADPLRPRAAWAQMQRACRNAGTTGIGAMAISAVDNALWDLMARLLDAPLVTVLGQFHDAANIYGSGGFCNLPEAALREQLRGWVEQGIPRVKIKVGREPGRDRERVGWALEEIGGDAQLLVDANGAYRVEEAQEWARWYADQGIVWLEEPVSSDDLHGLAQIRLQGPPGLAITAGEYGWDIFHFQRLIEHDAVDVVQPDVTRCGGYTSFLRVDGLCRARNMALSAHCSPGQSVHAVCACETAVHIEYFHDHTRIESMLFDGTLEPQPGGRLVPDLSRAGHGLELKRADAQRYAA
ncbi:MAG TPA: enolase C-terminal domain-like protein [Solirubrobacteraceae bacterium]|nr:enolase C-terminal domain-like protein [Solirubrobacteraceae bacterium]